jgi:hypothetical protein
MHEWCARVSERTGQTWRHARINQVEFDMLRPRMLEEANATLGGPSNNAPRVSNFAHLLGRSWQQRVAASAGLESKNSRQSLRSTR